MIPSDIHRRCAIRHTFAGLVAGLLFSVAPAGAVTYYVNDDSPAGDMYCNAAGTNAPPPAGQSPADPLRTVSYLIASNALAGGDTVYIDAGTYTDYPVMNASGTPGDPIVFQGATTFNGTAFDRQGANGVIWSINNLADMVLRNLAFRNANQYGLHVQNVGVDRVLVEDCLFLDNKTSIYVINGPEITFRRCIVARNEASVPFRLDNSGVARLENCTFYACNAFQKSGANAKLYLTNNIFCGYASYHLLSGDHTGVQGNYNLFFQDPASTWHRFWDKNTNVGDPANFFARLSDWRADGSRDLHSLYGDPRFVDPDNLDFRLQTNSPAVDAGDPAMPFANEPGGGGGRINLGAYGNTTNAALRNAGPWLQAVTGMDGGRLSGTNVFTWINGLPGGATVRMDYSPDNGASWSTVASGLDADSEAYELDTTTVPSSPRARWRVVYEADTGVIGALTNTFVVKNNTNFSFYVNDAATNGDVYCSAPGAAGNDGLSPGAPLPGAIGLRSLVYNVDLSGGDTVYIDAGLYTNNVNFYPEAGGNAAEGYVMFRGSTDETNPTMFQPADSGASIYIYNPSQYIHMRNIVFRGHRNCLYPTRGSRNLLLEDLRFSDYSQYGIYTYVVYDTELRRCTFDNTVAGRSPAYFWGGSGAGNRLLNCTFHDRQSSGFHVHISGNTSVSATNCIFYKKGANAPVVSWQSINDSIDSDFNVFFLTNSALLARLASVPNTTYTNLADFQATGQDLHSIQADPLFADAALTNFHLLSKHGRYDHGNWVRDDVSSPALDAGDTNSPYARETIPNGKRINCGMYGNTPYASRSPPEFPPGAMLIVR